MPSAIFPQRVMELHCKPLGLKCSEAGTSLRACASPGSGQDALPRAERRAECRGVTHKGLWLGPLVWKLGCDADQLFP